ncbi:DUF2946 domain-containing protein [soil metagenome]
MRRRLGIFIPIVLLAVLVQFLAPIAAFRMVAYASSDPLHMSEICSGMTDSGEMQTAPGQPPSKNDCCAYCGAAIGGSIAVDAPAPAFVALQLEFQKVAWLQASEPVPTLRVGSNAQARAPPCLS